MSERRSSTTPPPGDESGAHTRELEQRVETRTREVLQREARIRDLAERVTMAEQEERARISQVLHDDVQQLLYAVQMKLTLSREQVEAGNTAAVLEQTDQALGLLEEAVARTRRLTVDLSPPILEGAGVVEVLGWLQDRMRERHGLEVDVRGDPGLDVTPRELRVLLFQIVRELLFNVAKHAETDRATVDVGHENGRIVIAVEDRGRGFDAGALEAERTRGGHLGLYSVRERLRLQGGDLVVHSRPGDGTRVLIYAPAPPPS